MPLPKFDIVFESQIFLKHMVLLTRTMRLWLWLLGAYAILPLAIGQRMDLRNLPRLAGARLLAGYPPQSLAISTEDENLILRPDLPHGPVIGDESRIYPSISRDGNLIAAGRWKGGFPRRVVAVSTYSIREKKWTEYAVGPYESAVAISPDGFKLAYVENEKPAQLDSGFNGLYRVHVIHLGSGQESLGPRVLPVPSTMSWSPDGTKLAYSNHGIEVWDSETKMHRKIAVGGMPAWSPDGQWIAYLNTTEDPEEIGRDECLAVHPDGTGGKILAQLEGGRFFLEGPVWSPDSKRLLLNEVSDYERWTVDIDLLDLATLKLTRRLKNKVPVFAWAEVK
jgi:hypothetical protein